MWTKKVPEVEGWYWSQWKGKHGWQKTPAQLVVIDDNKIVKVMNAGTDLIVHKGVSEERAKKAFNFPEIQFWSEPMEIPK